MTASSIDLMRQSAKHILLIPLCALFSFAVCSCGGGGGGGTAGKPGMPQPLTQYITFSKTYGSALTNEYAGRTIQTSDGGYITGGVIYDEEYDPHGWLMKTDPYGNKLFEKVFGTTDMPYDVHSIELAPDGGIIAVGRKVVPSTGIDAIAMKFDAAGNVLWEKVIYAGISSEEAVVVKAAPDGGYFIGGHTASTSLSRIYDLLVAKIDAQGNVLWVIPTGGSDIETLNAIAVTSDGGCIVAGETWSYGNGYADMYTVRFDANGNILWSSTYGNEWRDTANTISETPDGGFLIAGKIGLGEESFDAWIVKVDSSGVPVWNKEFGGSESEVVRDFVIHSDGTFTAIVVTWSEGAGLNDLKLMRFSSTGSVIWEKLFGGADSDYPISISTTSDGGFIISGDTRSYGAGEYDLWLLKLDPDGSCENCF